VAGSSGTITGLPSGTASASYQSVGGTFQFESATNTPANITGATVYIAEQTTSPNVIGLKSPAALAASYDVTFPGAPAAGILRMDVAGAVSNNLVTDNSTLEISSNTLQVKNGGITNPKLAALGQQLSSSSGSFSTSSTTYVDVTNLTVTITTSGRPVWVCVIPDGSGSQSTIEITRNAAGATSNIQLVRDVTALTNVSFAVAAVGATTVAQQSLVGPFYLDVIGAGTYTYKVIAKVTSGTSSELLSISNWKLLAYEQ
jgi:hypothetical protein